MKILFIGGSFDGEKGGIERYNLTMLRHLRKLGHQVTAFSVNDRSSEGILGFERNLKKLIISYITRLPGAECLILGHIHFLPLVLPAVLLKKRRVLTAHGIEVWEKPSFLNRLIFRMLDQVWPVSTYTARKLTENFGKRVPAAVIPNTLPDYFPALREDQVTEKHNPGIPVRFLSVTRLSRSEGYKNVDLCLQALFGWQPPEGVEWEYHLVIHGDDADRVRELAERSGKVQVHSRVSDEKLAELYQSSTHFLLPSTGEGFGIVYLEAMANGLVCLGAAAGGIPDVIRDQETGFLSQVPVSSDEIKLQLTRMVSGEQRMNIAVAGWKSVSRFTFLEVGKKINQALVALEKM